MYALALRVVKDLHDQGLEPAITAYDNACKLLAMARSKKDCMEPYTQILAKVKFLLDRFHRDNHVWCLENMPEVDPETPSNAELLANVNTQACEQLNSWLTEHTLPACGMTAGRFAIYWWVMFREHNAWLMESAAAKRRLYARGHMKEDPDKVRRHPKAGRKATKQADSQ